MNTGKPKGQPVDSLSSDKSSSVHRRWACMQRSGVKVENYFLESSLNHMTASMSLGGGKKSCFPLLLFCQTLDEKHCPGQVPVSRGGFPDCEPQPQGGEMASSCAEESQRGLHYFSAPTVLPSVSFWSVCWRLQTLFRYS